MQFCKTIKDLEVFKPLGQKHRWGFKPPSVYETPGEIQTQTDRPLKFGSGVIHRLALAGDIYRIS